jgi:hypothetical protein
LRLKQDPQGAFGAIFLAGIFWREYFGGNYFWRVLFMVSIIFGANISARIFWRKYFGENILALIFLARIFWRETEF